MVPYLVAAFCPRYSRFPTDSRFYLPAIRHVYVLAARLRYIAVFDPVLLTPVQATVHVQLRVFISDAALISDEFSCL